MAEWMRVTTLDKLPNRTIVPFEVKGQSIVLVRMDQKIMCYSDFCTHQDVKLSDFGEIEKDELVCWAHGAHFDVCSGKPLCFPATEALHTHPVKVEEGAVFVEL